ncbi:uncharacterized protein TRAVEDRAFT_44194 [Trametes versicolor FP-101664 SS1]|uniref:uncharacterized protein n=1 Tax=Trametes versicolor (strain FP-101664) TaxID=717944 RepID=UPI00046230A2|nr:uncharacterized protein TRAVEDRAFT_44194 [Trametes versicolor FP-101664 SS1]EIW61378.1 hypothetical protein TRAVEDRAFT_44194 [Trametes versicolor FP-101664 SS1]
MRVAARDLYILDDQYYHDLFVVRALALAGYVILLYDCVLTFPDELLAQIKYIWPTRWSTVKVIYLLNRYGNLAFLGLADIQLMGMWWNDGPDFCYRAVLILSFAQLVSFALVHVLVLLRAWATWGRRKRMLTILGTLFIVYASVSIAMLTYGNIDAGPTSYPLAYVTKRSLGYFGLALECATFTLTMVSIRQFHVYSNWREHSPIVRVICRDGVIYFLVTLFSNSFNILIWARYADRPLNLLSTSFTLSLLIVAAQRLVLDLRKVTDEHDEVSTTRVGREVERAVQALPRSRSASPIVFVDLEALVGDGRGTTRGRRRGAALELTALRGGGRDRDRTVRT